MNPYSILNEFDKWFAWQRNCVEKLARYGFDITYTNCEADLRFVWQRTDKGMSVMFFD